MLHSTHLCQRSTRICPNAGIGAYAGSRDALRPGRLGRMGLITAASSEGPRSWQSWAYPSPLLPPGRATLRVNCGPDEATGGWTTPPPPPGRATLSHGSNAGTGRMGLLVDGCSRRYRKNGRLLSVNHLLDGAVGRRAPERPCVTWTALLRDLCGAG